MADDLALETVPTGTSGWISVVQDNFDEIEAFVNALHTGMIVHNGSVVTHDGEVLISF